jgi:hypothetical protein
MPKVEEFCHFYYKMERSDTIILGTLAHFSHFSHF